MALKTYNPTTPGQRGLVLIDRSELWKGRPVKRLTEGLSRRGGRNNTGRITARRLGGGAKRLYRIVDFRRRKYGVPATVEPDPASLAELGAHFTGEAAQMEELLGRRPRWSSVPPV